MILDYMNNVQFEVFAYLHRLSSLRIEMVKIRLDGLMERCPFLFCGRVLFKRGVTTNYRALCCE